MFEVILFGTFKNMSLMAQVGMISAILFVVSSIFLVQVVSTVVSQNFIDQEKDITSTFLERQTSSFLNPADFEHKFRSESDVQKDQEKFHLFFDAISTKNVIKFTIWDARSTVIYSNHEDSSGYSMENINKTDSDQEYKDAMDGIASSVVKTSADPNIEIKDHDRYLEVYVPVYLSGQETPVGVVEVYFSVSKLDSNVASLNLRILLITGTVFLILYFVLFTITKRASDTLLLQQRKIEESQRVEIERSKKLLKLKDQFFFVATHDLKAPIVAIRGFVDIISAAETKVPPDILEDIKSIEEAGERLNTLVKDLLEIARSESGTIKVETVPVNIVNIIEKVGRSAKPSADERNITLELNLDPIQKGVIGDEAKLTEVFENLVSNAIKYNKEGGKVSIFTKPVAGGLQVIVSDTGIGIPKGEQYRVFSRFFRSESDAVRAVSGTGLGLYVTKLLIEKMRGSINFNSNESKGTTFTVVLPTANIIPSVNESKQ